MEKLTEFLSMGGYGAYIWPAYALAATVMIAISAAAFYALKRARLALAAYHDEA